MVFIAITHEGARLALVREDSFGTCHLMFMVSVEELILAAQCTLRISVGRDVFDQYDHYHFY